MATQTGLTAADFECMSIGMILDHIITYHNATVKDDEPEKRKATAEDMAAF